MFQFVTCFDFFSIFYVWKISNRILDLIEENSISCTGAVPVFTSRKNESVNSNYIGKSLKRCAFPDWWRTADVFYYKWKQCHVLEVTHMGPNSGWQFCLHTCQKTWNWRWNTGREFSALISSSHSAFPQGNGHQVLGPGPQRKLCSLS